LIKRVASSAKCTKFIPFAGGGPTTIFSDLHISEQIMAGAKKSFIAEGSKPEKKKTGKRTSLKIGQGSYSTSKVNQNTWQTMNGRYATRIVGGAGIAPRVLRTRFFLQSKSIATIYHLFCHYKTFTCEFPYNPIEKFLL